MAELQTLDWVALCQMDNIDNIIEYNPYSTDIRLERKTQSGTFGYKDVTEDGDIVTKGLVIYPTDRQFLKSINIFGEDGKLPILGLFKDTDQIKENDIITQVLHDVVDGDIIDNNRTFKVTNITSFGDMRTAKKVFVLTPVRNS